LQKDFGKEGTSRVPGNPEVSLLLLVIADNVGDHYESVFLM
jgi:hypothetical protein